MRSSGREVRVTSAPEDTKVIVARRGTEESVVRSGSRTSRGGNAVKEIGGGVEALRPEARGQGGLKEKGAHDIVRGANHSLCLAILGRSVRARHTKLHTPREEERAGGVVVKLALVVTLDGLNSETELSGRPRKEVEEGGKRLRLGAQRKSPRVMGEIINYDKVILVSRHA